MERIYGYIWNIPTINYYNETINLFRLLRSFYHVILVKKYMCQSSLKELANNSKSINLVHTKKPY